MQKFCNGLFAALFWRSYVCILWTYLLCCVMYKLSVPPIWDLLFKVCIGLLATTRGVSTNTDWKNTSQIWYPILFAVLRYNIWCSRGRPSRLVAVCFPHVQWRYQWLLCSSRHVCVLFQYISHVTDNGTIPNSFFYNKDWTLNAVSRLFDIPASPHRFLVRPMSSSFWHVEVCLHRQAFRGLSSHRL